MFDCPGPPVAVELDFAITGIGMPTWLCVAGFLTERGDKTDGSKDEATLSKFN